MNKRFVSFLTLACCLSMAYSESLGNYNDDPAAAAAASDSVNSLFNTNLDSSNGADGDGAKDNLDKRVERYAFGLGRRAYTYTNGGNGIKRLPVYNFGLGKRARPYSFGLGKRFDYDDYEQMADNANLMAAHGGMMTGLGSMNDKRNRPYSFGLGKRANMADGGQSYSRPYGFGLGRR